MSIRRNAAFTSFASFARFEVRYQMLSPVFFAGAALLFGAAMAFTVVPELSRGLARSTTINSPFAITNIISTLAVLALFIPTALLANIVLRDREHLTADLFHTRPVTKVAYLGGRLTGAFLVSMFLLAAVPFGMLIGAQMPWLDPQTVGPVRPLAYVHAFFFYALPNLVIPGALLFSVATVTRSRLAAYTALVALLVLSAASSTLTADLEYRSIAALLDPLAAVAFQELVRYRTPVELETELLAFEGLFLLNRLLWLGVAALLLALTFRLFSFRVGSLGRVGKREDANGDEWVPIRLTTAAPDFGALSTMRQCLARLRYELAVLFKAPSTWVLIALGVLTVIPQFVTLGSVYGTPVLPITSVMMRAAASNDLIVLVVMLYLPAELIWRERALRANEITDALPIPSWAVVLPKLVTLWIMLTVLCMAMTFAAIAFQLVRGIDDIQLGLHASSLLFQALPPFLHLAALAMFVQVSANNRYVGMALTAGLIVAVAWVFPAVGLEHNLYRFGMSPSVFFSNLNGFGHFLAAAAWFNLYWGLASALLICATCALWSRGVASPLWRRAVQAPSRIGARARVIAASLLTAFVTTCAFIYYNTNVLNTYMDSNATEQQAVLYEERYRTYEDLPQPKITDVNVDVDIFPRERRYDARGTYVIENMTATPIGQVHIGYGFDTVVIEHALDGVSAEVADPELRHYVWTLDEPMQPGESRQLTFTVARENPGFRAGNNMSSVLWNGTYFNNSEFMPWIGFNERQMLQDRQRRRKYGLDPVDRLPPLEDERASYENILRKDSHWVRFETTVSTSSDQIAVAPGTLERSWEESDRRYFHYVMDTPMLNLYAYLSARYTLTEERANGILLQVFHHGEHAYNVPRMFEAMRDGIEYYSAAFGPFQFQQMRIFEFPQIFGASAQGFANTVPFSESAGFIADVTDPNDIDYVYYVTAHEVAHQWWAHQVIGARVQGAALLAESFAQYSALMLMERKYGEHHVRKYLRYELDRYLSSRGSELAAELPLYRVENQGYIHYQKGSLAMYALKDYVGEATVNRVLARLIQEAAYQHDPYPRSTDFLRILREESGPEHEGLIADLFEKIVLFDLETTGVEVGERSDGRFDVRITAQASKLEADGEGNESDVALDYTVDIGVFAKHPADTVEGADHVLAMEKRRVHEGENVFELIVDAAPLAAGIDPYNKLIDRDPGDNMRTVGTRFAR